MRSAKLLQEKIHLLSATTLPCGRVVCGGGVVNPIMPLYLKYHEGLAFPLKKATVTSHTMPQNKALGHVRVYSHPIPPPLCGCTYTRNRYPTAGVLAPWCNLHHLCRDGVLSNLLDFFWFSFLARWRQPPPWWRLWLRRISGSRWSGYMPSGMAARRVRRSSVRRVTCGMPGKIC